jgi:hypothetical protein
LNSRVQCSHDHFFSSFLFAQFLNILVQSPHLLGLMQRLVSVPLSGGVDLGSFMPGGLSFSVTGAAAAPEPDRFVSAASQFSDYSPASASLIDAVAAHCRSLQGPRRNFAWILGTAAAACSGAVVGPAGCDSR